MTWFVIAYLAGWAFVLEAAHRAPIMPPDYDRERYR